jgi:hypothetical protein
VSGTLALGREPEQVTQTLAFSLRRRLDCASVSGTLALGRELEQVTQTLAFSLRRRVRDAGAGKGAINNL